MACALVASVCATPISLAQTVTLASVALTADPKATAIPPFAPAHANARPAGPVQTAARLSVGPMLAPAMACATPSREHASVNVDGVGQLATRRCVGQHTNAVDMVPVMLPLGLVDAMLAGLVFSATQN